MSLKLKKINDIRPARSKEYFPFDQENGEENFRVEKAFSNGAPFQGQSKHYGIWEELLDVPFEDLDQLALNIIILNSRVTYDPISGVVVHFDTMDAETWAIHHGCHCRPLAKLQ